MRLKTQNTGTGWIARFSARISFGCAAVAVLAGGALLAQQNEYGDQSSTGQSLQQAVEGDPPSRVARLSELLGNVSVEPASVNQFAVGELNYPMTTGDRIYADLGSNAELETGQLAVRLGQQTDLTVTAMTDTLAQFGLATGSVHLRSFSLNGTVELDTPNISVTMLQPGDVRVDVDANNDITIVTVLQGQVQLNGNGLQTDLQGGQRVELFGGDPVQLRGLGRPGVDPLDRFSMDRDRQYQAALASESQYVDAGVIGAADLEGNGQWDQDDSYGPVWYPANMAVGWAPYTCGRWTWIAPWGWTWIDCAPWGFAPFHYGRWEHRPRGWGWIPGPPRLRPIYSPALVVFVGGAPGRGAGLTAWFPLGPRETYTPWYHASTLYINRVNVTNIYDRNEVEVRNTYNQRTLNVYANSGAGQQQYANRAQGTVAMQQTSFASGRPVAQGRVSLRPEQLAQAPIVPHPLVTPDRQMVVPQPSSAVPPHEARPVLATRAGSSVRGGATVEAKPAGAGSGPQMTGRPLRPFGGQPVPQMQQETARPQTPAPSQPQRQPQTISQTQPAAPTQPAAQSRAESSAPIQRGNPQPAPPSQAPMQPQPAPRSLVNQAVPPPPRPSFELQRQAIQQNDPGRPLGPQQMQNLRQNQPAGPPQQREQPHAAPPQQRPAPAPAAQPQRNAPSPASPPASKH